MTYHFKYIDVYIIDTLGSRKMDDIVIIIRTLLYNITIAKSSINIINYNRIWFIQFILFDFIKLVKFYYHIIPLCN